jgi:flagellar biosynthesis chaperone FliJ
MRGQKRRGRQITAEALEEKISKAQDKLAITKKAYDEAAQELRNLLDKRDAIRKDELYNKLVGSRWTYEQVIKLLSSDPPDDD